MRDRTRTTHDLRVNGHGYCKRALGRQRRESLLLIENADVHREVELSDDAVRVEDLLDLLPRSLHELLLVLLDHEGAHSRGCAISRIAIQLVIPTILSYIEEDFVRLVLSRVVLSIKGNSDYGVVKEVLFSSSVVAIVSGRFTRTCNSF